MEWGLAGTRWGRWPLWPGRWGKSLGQHAGISWEDWGPGTRGLCIPGFVVVQLLGRIQLFATPGTAARQASLSFTILLKLAQTHVHQVGDAHQPSHPLPSPCLPTFDLSQHHGLFQWVSPSNQVAKVLELQLQYQSFQWIFRTGFL